MDFWQNNTKEKIIFLLKRRFSIHILENWSLFNFKTVNFQLDSSSVLCPALKILGDCQKSPPLQFKKTIFSFLTEIEQQKEEDFERRFHFSGSTALNKRQTRKMGEIQNQSWTFVQISRSLQADQILKPFYKEQILKSFSHF